MSERARQRGRSLVFFFREQSSELRSERSTQLAMQVIFVGRAVTTRVSSIISFRGEKMEFEDRTFDSKFQMSAFLIPLLLSDVAHSSIQHRFSFCPIDSGHLTLSSAPSLTLKAVIDRQMMPPVICRFRIFRQKLSNLVWRMAMPLANSVDKMNRPTNLYTGRVNKIVGKPVVSVSMTLI